MSDKPNAARINWFLHSTQYMYHDPRISIRRDACTWPDGVDRPFTYIEGPPAVIIVPFTPEGNIVLIRQFRYTVDEWVWEVVAGGSHDFEGDDLLPLASRELKEEIGGTAQEIIEIGEGYLGVGVTDKRFTFYAAFGVELDVPEPEPGELIEVHVIPMQQALDMIHSGNFPSMPSALAILRSVPYWRKRCSATCPQGG